MIPISKPLIQTEAIEAVKRVLASGQISSGPETEAFESEFSTYVGTGFGIAVNSGTSALLVALMASGIGPGDEVIVPSFTFAATANAVRLVGASPVFADIDPATFCLDPDHATSLVNPRTAAIMPVHLFGQPANMDAITELAQRHGLYVLEDAAQAHGARWRGHQVGGLGDSGAFSFYPTKNMTTGEGGMITTNDSSFARRCRLIRNQGMEERYVHEVVGMNLRMTDIHSAIGRVQLRFLEEWNAARRRNARSYDAALADSVQIPTVDARAEHVYHQYTLRVGMRSKVIEQLDRAGVGYGVYYPTPTHRQPPYLSCKSELPATDHAASEVLSIPIRPDLSERERQVVIEAVNNALVGESR